MNGAAAWGRRQSEPDLIAQAQAGHRAALEQLLGLHYDRVSTICNRIAGDTRDGDDATQEALVRIVKHLPRFDGRSQFSTWVYRVATNAALDELRRRKRRPQLGVAAADGTVREPIDTRTEQAFSQVTDSAMIHDALKQLSEEYRTVLVMREVADLDYAEIANTLGIPIGTVRSRLARARRTLQAVIGNQMPDAERLTDGASPPSP